MHIPLPETDNCPSWISRRENMTVENISWSISTKECCRSRRGLNPRPPGLQSDGASNWATEAGRHQGLGASLSFQLQAKYMYNICSQSSGPRFTIILRTKVRKFKIRNKTFKVNWNEYYLYQFSRRYWTVLLISSLKLSFYVKVQNALCKSQSSKLRLNLA